MTCADITPEQREADLPAGSAVIRLDRDLGIVAAAALRLRLTSALSPGVRLLVLDLSRVQSCDPAGLAVLIGAQRQAAERGIVVRLAAPSAPVAELLRSTGLERCLTVCPDLSGALARGRGEPARAAVPPQIHPGAVAEAATAGVGPRKGTHTS